MSVDIKLSKGNQIASPIIITNESDRPKSKLHISYVPKNMSSLKKKETKLNPAVAKK